VGCGGLRWVAVGCGCCQLEAAEGNGNVTWRGHVRSLAVACGRLRSLAVACGRLRSLAVACGRLRSLARTDSGSARWVVFKGIANVIEMKWILLLLCMWTYAEPTPAPTPSCCTQVHGGQFGDTCSDGTTGDCMQTYCSILEFNNSCPCKQRNATTGECPYGYSDCCPPTPAPALGATATETADNDKWDKATFGVVVGMAVLLFGVFIYDHW